ncbi:MAG: sugar ABC transporter substrate-binding protein [Gemmatimonadaceae bacterium]|nr:sugar ABC transporter substrate-binding protein [Gemmatimonadaceae bacterium]NUQ91607.1 sugar ABC transporter substrate-binding protein [Gemmatimonadaceae bacterium]NUR18618.1 sugar ABC transporter substrate-binding protein [Gemmatimonadaceae bacterium]NUS96685.1 sugar ABC transporter substrate-binding protein [Gemmatimonadaceae bacterium]
MPITKGSVANRETWTAATRVLVAAASLTLFACVGSGPRDHVELRFWGMGREGEVVGQMIPEFERLHPGIKVRVQQMPWTAAHEKLLTSFVGEATPDVAQLGNTWVPEFEAIGALAPLGGHVRASAVVDSADYFRGIWDTNVVNDTLFGIPWYVDTRLVFYRKDLFAAAGVAEPPRTWSAWRDAMRKVQRTGKAKWGILLPTNEWAQPVALSLQAGSPILAQGGRYGAFSDSAFARAFHFYVSLYRDSIAPTVSASEISNLYQEFARGTFASFISGPWQIGELKNRLPDSLQGAWAAMPLPAPDGQPYPGLSLAGGSSVVMFAGSEHKREAWQLIEFLSEPAQQAKFARLTGDLPARESAWKLAKLDSSAAMVAFLEQLRHVAPTPKVPEWENIATKVFETGERVVRGRVSEKDALAQLDAEVNAMLEKRRWLLARR